MSGGVALHTHKLQMSDSQAGLLAKLASSREVRADRTLAHTVAGRELTLWRHADGVVAGPGACPHMGALLDACPVVSGTAYCRWHGLPLEPAGGPGWSPFAAHDDGVLVWVRLPVEGETATDTPVLPARPPLTESIAAVITQVGVCEPREDPVEVPELK